jgi:hypothetical protein
MTPARLRSGAINYGIILWTGAVALLATTVIMLLLIWDAPVFALLAAYLLAALVAFPEMTAGLITSLGIVGVMSGSFVLFSNEFGPSPASVISRVIGAFLIAAGGVAATQRAPLAISSRRSGIVGSVIIAIALPVWLFFFWATVPHGMWKVLLVYGLGGLPVFVTVVYFGAKSVASGSLRCSVITALSAIVAGSIVLGVFVPELGVEAGRLRGLQENANGLGFMAFLLGAVGLLVLRRSSRICVLALAVIALVWTASRASALAMGLVALLICIERRPFARGLYLAMAGMGLWCVCVLYPPLLAWAGKLDILRTNNSRAGTVEEAFAVLVTAPWSGVGWSGETTILASSPLGALIRAGLPGLLAILLLWVLLLRFGFRAGFRSLTLVTAGIVHSMFEGWLLSPVGPMLLTFVLALLVVVDEDRHGAMTQHAFGTRKPSASAVRFHVLSGRMTRNVLLVRDNSGCRGQSSKTRETLAK